MALEARSNSALHRALSWTIAELMSGTGTLALSSAGTN